MRRKTSIISFFKVLRDQNVEGCETLFVDVEDDKKRNAWSRGLMRLGQTILSKRERNNLVVWKKSGWEVVVSLTGSARYGACLSGLLE